MSNQISSQATKLWQTVSAPSTANTYREALTLTWAILRETGTLLWLVLCLGLVAADWFWTNSVDTGRRARLWWNTIDEPNTNRIASEAGRTILEAGKSSVAFTLAQARESLGLPQKAEPLQLEASKPTATPSGPTSAASPLDAYVTQSIPQSVQSPVKSGGFSEPTAGVSADDEL
jgi:hypothetical protein